MSLTSGIFSIHLYPITFSTSTAASLQFCQTITVSFTLAVLLMFEHCPCVSSSALLGGGKQKNVRKSDLLILVGTFKHSNITMPPELVSSAQNMA